MNYAFRALLPIVLALLLANCGSTRPLGESGFLDDPGRLSKAQDLPFKKSWTKPGADLRNYGPIEVAPVTVEFLQFSEKDRASSKRAEKKRTAVVELARYSETAFRTTLEKIPSSDQPLVCEVAIVEFEPAIPLANAAGYSLGLLGGALREIVVSGGGTVVRSSGVRGYLAIEARLRDPRSGDVLFIFADAARGRPSIVNIKDFQPLGHAKAQIRTWAKQCAASLRKEPKQRVREELPIDLKPW